MSWASASPDEALTWARGLAGKERETAMAEVLARSASYQPTTAASEFDEVMATVLPGSKPADRLVAAAGAIATAYFAEDQEAAAAWASNLPQEEARSSAVRSLAEQWAQSDPAAASEWIGTLPEGKPRDAAVGQLVERIALSDPSAALAWASTVVDSADRSRLLQTTFASWRKLDAAAARIAIEATNWPDAEKNRWLDKVK